MIEGHTAVIYFKFLTDAELALLVSEIVRKT